MTSSDSGSFLVSRRSCTWPSVGSCRSRPTICPSTSAATAALASPGPISVAMSSGRVGLSYCFLRSVWKSDFQHGVWFDPKGEAASRTGVDTKDRQADFQKRSSRKVQLTCHLEQELGSRDSPREWTAERHLLPLFAEFWRTLDRSLLFETGAMGPPGK